MSPPGRPKGEWSPSAEREGMLVSAPRATALAMYLHAVWMSLTSAISSAPPSSLRCSSMMNFDSVVRPWSMVNLPEIRGSPGCRRPRSSAARRASPALASANSRFAWRRRARSSALRIERALAKFGCVRRIAMYSRSADSASASSR